MINYKEREREREREREKDRQTDGQRQTENVTSIIGKAYSIFFQVYEV